MKKIHPTLRLVLALTVVGFAMTYFVCRDCASYPRIYFLVGIFCSLTWISLWVGNEWVSNLASRVFSWTEQPSKRFFFGLVTTLVYTLTSVYLLTITFRWLTNINVSFKEDMLYSTVVTTFIISAFMHGHGFLESWRQAALDSEASKRESAVARYEALKSQINPHFLFNSLNALTNLVYEDQDKAVRFIQQLSEVYRYVLDSREKEVVNLDEELRFVRSYLFLQQIRFGNNLNVNLKIDNERGKVAPLALQLLLENAIKHNIISSDDPLLIEVYVKNGFICVENSLQKKSLPPENGTGVGLENIRNRYKFLTNKEVIISEAGGKFSVMLPLIEPEAA